MKKLILTAVIVATVAGFALFQTSNDGTCSRTTCEDTKKVATTCNGSDAQCSGSGKIDTELSLKAQQVLVEVAGCGDPLCCGGGQLVPTDEGEKPVNPHIPT